MALIRNFKAIGPSARQRLHGSEVDCGWDIFTVSGRTYLQLDTYGSGTRAFPGKVSQTIQLDEEAARKLKKLIKQAFPNL
jgi:hypothetical protein